MITIYYEDKQLNKSYDNVLGDWGSIPGQVRAKIQKMVLDIFLLNTHHYKVRIKGKGSNPEKGVVPSLTLLCSSYWKESLQVALDYGQRMYNFIYIYIYIK